MSNRPNHRRGDARRTEHGPSWEAKNPSKGCNSTHVARARSKWKKRKNRSLRRNGKVTPKYHAMGRCRPIVFEDLDE